MAAPSFCRSLVLLISLGATLGACGESYCQSGPKFGTSCYSTNQLGSHESERTDLLVQRATQPSPGCAVLTPRGVYTVPQPGAGAAPPSPPPPYLMSGACVSSRQPVRGGAPPVTLFRPGQ